MKLIVHPHKIEIEKTLVNEKELNVTKVQFEFVDIPDNYVKEAYFTLDNTYKVILTNDKCDIPNEVLTKTGTIEIGVVAYLVENETEIKRYNPSPVYINTLSGSLKNAVNSEEYTPTDKEQIEQMLDNINIDANKQGIITTITITNKDGTEKTVTLEDGKSIEYNWQGTRLGIKREDESTYQYVDLKGEKGEPGAIKMVIVNALPLVGDTDTIYLVPLENPETQENNYAEYIYVNGQWELLGKIGIQVDLSNYYTKTETDTLLNGKANTSDIPDLTDYVKNTDYAGQNIAGVIKTSNASGTTTSNGLLQGSTRNYEQYNSSGGALIVSKGTLENVITGKGLVSNTDYASSNKGGVIKAGSAYNAYSLTSDGFLQTNIRTYEQYQQDGNRTFIGKGTLENVLTARIGDIDSILDAINGEEV